MVSESIDKVVVHPLVLLSVVDHYNRVAKDTRKRVVGVLLGESYKGRIDATNSFAGARLARGGGGSLLGQLCVWAAGGCHATLGRAEEQCTQAPLPLPSPAVPFEEDEKDPSIWFLDHNYLENMFRMFKKVNGAAFGGG